MDFGLAKRVEDLPSPDAATREMGGGPLTVHGDHRRHAGLHVAGTDERRAARCAVRPVFLRRDAGRDDERAASVPQAIDDGNAFRGARGTAALGGDIPPRSDGRAAASAGQGRRESLRVHRRGARRSGAAGVVAAARRGRARAARRAAVWRRPALAALVDTRHRTVASVVRRRLGLLAPGLSRAGSRPASFDRLPCFRSTTTRAIPTRTTSLKG